MKIMKDHGIESQSTKLNYEIPALIAKQKTPVNELFNMSKNEEPVMNNEKMTVAKPFDFQTAKRMRLQALIEQENC